MKATETDSNNRKDQILSAAFSIIRENDHWSLSDIAREIGVSKTALYRHFTNRAEIEYAMNSRFESDFIAMVESTDGSPTEIRASAFRFFKEKSGYLNLFLYNFTVSHDYGEQLGKRIIQKSELCARFFAWTQTQSVQKQEKIIIAIIKTTVSILTGCFFDPITQEGREELRTRLGEGFPELEMPSQARLDELDSLATILPSDLTEENKLFSAIAASIRKFGITNTTIETIAQEMGMAKSSLYFYFDHKSEMLVGLMERESNHMISLFRDRAEKGNTFAEQLYLVMSIQALYLLKKPDILPVFNWIRYETVRKPLQKQNDQANLQSFLEPFHYNQLSLRSLKAEQFALVILKWASIMSTSTIIQGQRQNADHHTSLKNVRLMFYSMMYGDKEIL